MMQNFPLFNTHSKTSSKHISNPYAMKGKAHSSSGVKIVWKLGRSFEYNLGFPSNSEKIKPLNGAQKIH